MEQVPIRIQRRRTKGWRLPQGAISVTRPGKWGNPYFPGCGLGFGGFDSEMRPAHWPLQTKADMVRHFREHMRLMRMHEPERYAEYIRPLQGLDLACWCPIGEPCHADVLIELAAAFASAER